MTEARTRLPTPRLLLLASDPSLAGAVAAFHARNREHLAQWDPPRPDDHFTAGGQRRRLALEAAAFAEGRGLRWWLTAADAPGEVIGFANAGGIVRGAFHSAMLGFALDAAHVGRGLMTEALEAVIAEAFSARVDLHRLQANHLPENERSAATLARLGFAREGLAPAYLFIAGAWRDHVLTARTNPGFRGPAGG